MPSIETVITSEVLYQLSYVGEVSTDGLVRLDAADGGLVVTPLTMLLPAAARCRSKRAPSRALTTG